MYRFAARPRLIAVLLAVLALGCAETTTAPESPEVEALRSSSSSVLITCPTNSTQTATAVIGPLGGTLSVAGSSITLQPGSVLLPTEVTMTVPASRYVEVEITANGQEHFDFEVPVIASISYARCTRSNILTVPLSVWYIDGSTKNLLELMGGVDDKLSRTVTFTTLHLSSYAVAE